MGRLADKLTSGDRVITAEITPPKGAGIKKMLRNAQIIGPHVDAINITDCQRALVKMSSLAASRVLLDAGFEPVYQLTCRDRNSIGLQADLMGAAALSIPNLLCLTGDPVKVGDSPGSKSVFEVEAVRLLEIVASLQGGHDASGIKMNAPTRFCVGAVVNPTLKSLGQLSRMQRKIAAGACFFQTQANYDNADFRGFLVDARKLGTKVLAGILILHSAEVARYIHENIPGISLPDAVLERFARSSDVEATAIDVAVETMLAVEDVCDGFHLMTVRMEEFIPKVLSAYHARKSETNSAISPAS